MKKRIPQAVQSIMQRYGVNKAELLANGIYTLYLEDNNGNIVPIGLPILVKYSKGKAVRVTNKDADKILKTK